MTSTVPSDIDAAYRRAPSVTIGSLPIAAITRAEAAELILDAVHRHERGTRPLFFTSANGEVIARVNTDPEVAHLFGSADQIVADGQPMVIASRFVCHRALPERVATTDLFHDVAERAEQSGESFYLFGATPDENSKALAAIRQHYPRLAIAGASHGFLSGAALDAKLAEINALRPDILWLALGVPREQRFFAEHGHKLPEVGLIKTSGGLFNFLSGTNRRAPALLQRLGLEWAFRLLLEPRRLGWRYFSTNPVALFLILTRSS
jgi:N-acetylglucosaminyldiphosphoundecaprenol N-acetyl-beta-D-mannosaminyltransferase